MRWTNNLELPEPVVNAVINDPYTKGDSDISITGLCGPPRIRVLKKLHEADLVEDVSDRIFSLLGQVMHGILERAHVNDLKKAIFEKRWHTEIDGVRISGQLDAYYTDGLIQDYKLLSMYSVKDGVKLEYEQQLNCYAHLLRVNGLVVTKLQLVCILRDWSKGRTQYDYELPQQQVLKLEVPLWTPEKAEEFLKERVALHKAANKKLPLCTAEERWEKPEKFAAMPAPKAPKSKKNHDTLAAAEEHVLKLKKEFPKAFVEHRPAVQTRCENYCVAKAFCKQAKKLGVE